jgi:hypothetical protein
MRRQPGLVIGFGVAAVLAIVAGAMGAALVRQSDAIPSSSAGLAVASAAPATPSIRPAPSPAAPSAVPRHVTASPTPADGSKPAATSAKWSKPQRVGGAACGSVTAAIDGHGGYHLAARCDGEIHYLDLNTDDWDPVTFKPPKARQELDPQMAVEGDLLYLAYNRVGGGGCDGLNDQRDVGVYVRTRSLTSGRAWSDPKRIGEVGDRLQGFRVVGGTIHAMVANGKVYYETVRNGSVKRYEIPGAIGATSLRIGDDGRARVAYESGNSLRYATFTGAGFSSKKIPGTSRGYAPALVLGANDQPYLMWRRGDGPNGCGTSISFPSDGTYFSTRKGGSWHSERLVGRRQVAAIAVDTSSGRVHVLVCGKGDRLVYLTRVGTGSWSKRIVDPSNSGPAEIVLDQATGHLLIAYENWIEGGHRLSIVTKR